MSTHRDDVETCNALGPPAGRKASWTRRKHPEGNAEKEGKRSSDVEEYGENTSSAEVKEEEEKAGKKRKEANGGETGGVSHEQEGDATGGERGEGTGAAGGSIAAKWDRGEDGRKSEEYEEEAWGVPKEIS
ncbi:hypothetical protein NDU88_001874 [Pleurodeles waltl]|uniref:Uncharacterized protein n=1 Tax=Pleurodeles waltl TaxID=8319 RepID=A0AAV7UAP7_PLEWA|nr:hypothetical protein NDU88_001874 [Pleurodeles waltl]